MTVVHVIDSDVETRQSLRTFLSSEGYHVHDHGDAARLFRCYADVMDGCVILDHRLPDLDALAVLTALRDRSIHPPVIMTGQASVPIAVAAMKLGAADFVEKPYALNQILNAIRDAIAPNPGGNTAPEPEAATLVANLSPRERDVLCGVIAGFSNKQIARDLGISPRTVETHRASMMGRIGASSMSSAVRTGLAAGLGAGSSSART
jgi:two-component system response regulator FixJ